MNNSKQNSDTNGQSNDKPLIPFAGVVYGDMVYWGTIAGTFITIIGMTVMFLAPSNYIDTSYLLSSVWQGKNVEEIWVGAVGSVPDGHWYLSEISSGNGITMGGIALGVFSVTPAILGAAFILFKERQRFFGVLALISAAITVVAMFA